MEPQSTKSNNIPSSLYPPHFEKGTAVIFKQLFL